MTYEWNLNDLNPAQREVVENGDGAVLVLAGAGSGKTRVLTYRIVYLIRIHRIPPYRILALTFTNKAANEMLGRICKLLGEEEKGMWVGTFHATCAKILRRESKQLGWEHPFVIYNEDDQLRLMKDIMEERHYPTDKHNPRSILNIISKAKAYLKKPADSLGNGPFYEMVEDLYGLYEKNLRKNNALDFDDLINKVIELFQTQPDVLEKYGRQFRYMLVDEFQDTNVAQYRLLQLLAKSSGNLMVVGDDDQSIYRWRGAEVGNILQFDKDFPGTRIYHLDQNYRSTGNILSTAQAVVRNNALRREKRLWTDRVAGDKVTVTSLETAKEEAAWVSEKIRGAVAKEGRRLSDFGILYRTNAQARAIEEELRLTGLPYVVVGGVRFYERKEVRDILAYLQILINPSDEISLKRIVNFPPRGLGKVTLDRLDAYARENGIGWYRSLGEIEKIAGLSAGVRKKLASFYALIEKYTGLRRKITAGELVRSLTDELGIASFYREDGSQESLDRWNNVNELLAAVSDFSRIHEEGGLEDFLSHVSLVTSIDLVDGKKEAVTLMTVHNAKGLEFTSVFITGLEEGLFPVAGSLDSLEALEEERRLFYVGATRAMDHLSLTWAFQRSRFGRIEVSRNSRFINELDANCVETIDRRSVFYAPPAANHPLKKKTSSAGNGFSYQAGQEVRHPNFGTGYIRKIEGYGDQAKLTVYFNNVGEKKLFAKFARLETRA